ncbi:MULTISPECIES: class I SAM-dependent methyltransferase [Halocynthiibacter]|uniref:Class I SAM-dependent methyltransferase n=1 Tax=Halocynthiibacter halioticoli TaxID=2986804 RepID=A0AAE3J1I4_9RHOB|nr:MULTISPECIES: class I SAM-dependent methyltransferase [Halocynthiibacter]MCV6824828.1 class I SAM-dependent methyltransferase [Halocynthiibacter halioticoli]MCW4057829.1 class I SAM-dependent methyltransferase [Halocynthiibacter sp. SDUM655004]
MTGNELMTDAGQIDEAKPIAASERYGRGQINLTDLADRFGSDKGSKKHRYSELYQMLFLPYRERELTFLEMGLQIGGPEHGKHADRPTTDAPSIRMWLEFFPDAHIHGLDVSDFSWFSDSRFTFHRCDMDTRENIREAMRDVSEFDIVIDDASHASHHQQNAFLELFQKVKSGGLYIIEDLRWQPPEMERPDYPKTSALFQEYIKTGVFAHNDPHVAKELNAARIDISGCFVFQAKFDKKRRDQVLVVHKR